MSMNYHGFKVLVSKREDESWISWTPQEPGISSWGCNKNEAIEGIQRSINEFIEMKKNGEPRTDTGR